jgi:hypothetical protein
MQALALSGDRATKRALEVAYSAHVPKLDKANAELRAELEQARLKIAEAEESQNSGYTRLEDECEALRNAAEALKREKAEAETAHGTEVTAIHKRFENYHVHHRRKLHDLRFHLEKAVDEFGAGCLPYPGKNSTIGSTIVWFDNEIEVLPATVAKENKFFVCYAVVGILWMLYDNSCDHIEGLQSIMATCDASILYDLPEELSKLTGRLVKNGGWNTACLMSRMAFARNQW